MKSNKIDFVFIQRKYGFSHHTSAHLLEDGLKLMDFEPNRAEEKFKTLIQLEPNNPHGYIHLLFAMEDNSRSISKLLNVCEKFVNVAEKRPTNGLDGLSKLMMNNYLAIAEKL